MRGERKEGRERRWEGLRVGVRVGGWVGWVWGGGVRVQVNRDTCADAPERKQSARGQIHKYMHRFIHIYTCTYVYVYRHMYKCARTQVRLDEEMRLWIDTHV